MHCAPLRGRLLADLNCPVFSPEPISLDRKHILEDIESKYREFITATLRCLSELKRELREWHMQYMNVTPDHCKFWGNGKICFLSSDEKTDATQPWVPLNYNQHFVSLAY